MITREFNNEALLDLIRSERGLDLKGTSLTGEMMIDSDHGFAEWMAGPFILESEGDNFTVFISYTDTDSLFIQFLIRDCEGDFLNGGVATIEDQPINDKPISLGWEHPFFDPQRR
jgi:hypothetical protein